MAAGPGVVVVDSVYSTTGALCPLREMVEVVERHGAMILVDESHSLGTHGPRGAGLCAELGLGDRVHFITASLAKAVAGDATAFPASQALRAATINGAKALGLDGITGSLETGKAADMIAVDMACIEASPLYNVVSQLVYATSRQQVTHAWVAGRELLPHGLATRADGSPTRSRRPVSFARFDFTTTCPGRPWATTRLTNLVLSEDEIRLPMRV